MRGFVLYDGNYPDNLNGRFCKAAIARMHIDLAARACTEAVLPRRPRLLAVMGPYGGR
jgi:hypothetical protein